jgi:CRISPR/Cas system-associated exonuclease Cas4 (RecB family)
MKVSFDRPHWSFSALSQFLKCPLAFYFERVLRLPKRTISDSQVLGSAVHSALAHYHRELQQRTAVDRTEVEGSFLQAWQDQCSLAEVSHQDDRSDDDLKAQGVALVELYLQLPPPQNILAVEQPMLVPIANSEGEYLEKPLLVIPDLITRDDESPRIREIKTANRAYSESEIASSLQPACYGHAIYELTGEEPAIEFTVLIKTKVPKLQRIEAPRNSADFARLGDIIQAVDRAVDAGVFYPVESPMNCSGCPFYRPCREWAGNRINGEVTELIPKEAVPC